MFEFDLTPELVVGIVAAVLAFVFDYFPVLADWYNGLDETNKKRYMFVFLFVTVAAIFAGDCFGVFITYLVCTVMGLVDVVKLLLAAVAINQGVHMLFKPSAAYKARRFGSG